MVYLAALAAGMRVDRDEPGLLPDDPRRRPGDLFFPTFPGGVPAALDFAVTSPLKMEGQGGAATTTLHAAMQYEEHKLADRDTAARCRRLGLQLKPMVVETLGGWGPEAQKVLWVVAKAQAAASGQLMSLALNHLYQGLAVKLQRANAGAMLARASAVSSQSATALATLSRAEAALVGAEAEG